jgi:UTP-glucose-1-phosphate uridylyltransferase
MNTALVIMAAGIGSRFGGGIKQLEPVGPSGEIIMDYSIHDALEAGFNKLVFIIRKDIEEDFRQVIGNRIEAVCAARGVQVAYAFQSLDAVPEGVTVPEGRTKPWGTGQAVLSARDVIDCPFAVINADDYYGKEAYVKLHDFLSKKQAPNAYAMAGFILKNTLSENGGVTRGICQVNGEGYLTNVVETSNIVKTAEGAEVDGVAVDPNAYVSMNMWGLNPAFMDVLQTGFEEFFRTAAKDNPLKAEYLLPIYIGQLLRGKKLSVQVLETKDKWFGVTYREDKAAVVESFRQLIEAGVYASDLFGAG